MIGTAFVIGFFTAMGWFSAQKIVALTGDTIKSPVTIEQQQKEIK